MITRAVEQERHTMRAMMGLAMTQTILQASMTDEAFTKWLHDNRDNRVGWPLGERTEEEWIRATPAGTFATFILTYALPDAVCLPGLRKRMNLYGVGLWLAPGSAIPTVDSLVQVPFSPRMVQTIRQDEHGSMNPLTGVDVILRLRKWHYEGGGTGEF